MLVQHHGWVVEQWKRSWLEFTEGEISTGHHRTDPVIWRVNAFWSWSSLIWGERSKSPSDQRWTILWQRSWKTVHISRDYKYVQ
jgi:hypothetical protein